MKPGLTIALVVLSVAAILPAGQTGQDLFQKALARERAEGDPAGAISLYERVVKQSGQDRMLAAEALLRIGECHQALGNAEARRAFERVIREFSDQTEAASKARARLAALTLPEHKPTFTKIRIPSKLPDDRAFALSADGARLAYVSDGSVWVLPVHGASDPSIAGAPRRLTEPVQAWSRCADIVWSRDGNWLAVHVVERSRDGSEVRAVHVVRSTTGEVRRLSLDLKPRALLYLDPLLSLSPDGRWLAYTSWQEGESWAQKSVYLAPVAGGIARRLTQPATASPSFSPDGTKIAYLGTVIDKSWAHTYPRARQVWVVPVSGGTPVLVYAHPGPGLLHGPTWSADGKMIAFLLNHGRATDGCGELMIIPLRDDGRTAGSPTLITLAQETAWKPVGWSPDNRIGLSFTSPELTAVYSVPASGGRAVQLTPKDSTMPRWMPDQKKIYFSGTNQGEFYGIEFVPAEGGKVTRIPVRGPHATTIGYPGMSISPHGTRILFQGRFTGTPEGRPRHIFTIPIEGGQITEIATGIDQFCYPAWAPDGESFAFVGYQDVTEGKTLTNIYIMPATGGKAQKVTSDSDEVADGPVAWSPDGSSLAFYSGDGSDNDKVKLVPVGGGPARVVVGGLRGAHDETGLTWAPDGKELAYITDNRIWKVSLDTGRSQEVKTGLDANHLGIAWSPDGRTIAFSARQGGEPELWIMENFLPRAPVKR